MGVLHCETRKAMWVSMAYATLRRLLVSFRGALGTPIQLNLSPPLSEKTQRRDTQRERELVPGNFLWFGFFIGLKLGDAVHLGYPKAPIRDVMTKEVRWGSNLEYAWPDPSKPPLPWVDDPQRGIAQRTITSAEDILGAEGTLGGRLFRFERILELGNSFVVYALFNPETRTRIACGFSRNALEPGYVSPTQGGATLKAGGSTPTG